jgi:hypothetical protein
MILISPSSSFYFLIQPLPLELTRTRLHSFDKNAVVSLHFPFSTFHLPFLSQLEIFKSLLDDVSPSRTLEWIRETD